MPLKKIELSKRLHTASEFVVPNLSVLDIGSDHAYLPIYLVQNKHVPQAIAGEVALGPFRNAKSKVEQYQLEDKISVRLGDGLEVLKPADTIGTIFICGMGGALISTILKKGLEMNQLPEEARLVLQANNAEASLRQVLVTAGYKIIEEEIMEENDKIYELMIAEYAKKPVEYTADSYVFGPILREKRSDIFIKKWIREIQKLDNILEQLEKSAHTEKAKQIREKIQRIEQVIS